MTQGAAPDDDALLLPVTRARAFASLLPRDPDWALAFWEVTPDDVTHAARALGAAAPHARLALRLYCVDRPADHPDASFCDELEVDEWLGSRYLMLGRAGALHAVAIGLRAPDGAFHALARSPWVQAPRGAPAPPSHAPPTSLRVEVEHRDDGRLRLRPRAVDHPDAPADQPDAPADQPDAPADRPDASAD